MSIFTTLVPVEPRVISPRELRAGVSPDGLEISILFDSLVVESRPKGAPFDLVLAACRLPVELPDACSLAGYLVHVRGGASLSSGARGWIGVQFGAAHATRTWPLADGGPQSDAANADEFLLTFFAEDLVLSKEANPARPSPLAPILTIVAGVERQESLENALINVAAVDVSALFFQAGATEKQVRAHP